MKKFWDKGKKKKLEILMGKNEPTQEQKEVLKNKNKKLIVSASAGSGKTFVVIEYLINLICNKKIPISRLLVLTFTKAAANEMKTRLYNEILQQRADNFLLEQIDEISISDITTIDAFCEKLIKRNINKTDIDEEFVVLDEKMCDKLKQMAFARAFDEMNSDESEDLDKLFFSFKKDKDKIFSMLRSMQSFFGSSKENETLVDDFIKNADSLKIKANSFITDYIYSIFSEAKNKIQYLYDLPIKYEEYRQNLLGFCSIKDDDFLALMKKINEYEFMKMANWKIDNKEDRKTLSSARQKLKNVNEIAGNYQDISPEIVKKLTDDNLSEIILTLYKKYSCEYKALKKSKNGLDFADLELYCKELLEDKETMESLQDKYDYIFIDEYQDTNRLQESIIKPISQKGHFIAVGDPKQGIYGFRNASMEIMQDDIKDFKERKDGDALFLKGNFRTDKHILDFVNKIFAKVMTEKSVGIDYENTSMLEGLKKFEKAKMPSVRIDIIEKEKDETQKEIKEIYSVKEDEVSVDEKYKKEVETIASRIEECLRKQIYDAKREKYRNVEPRDIALLFRGSKGLMPDVVKFLQAKGFDIVADVEQELLDDKEIKTILSILKLSINTEDDISILSAMNSWFGKFSLDDIIQLRIDNKDKFFSQIVSESQETRLANFREKIEKFYFNSQVVGISKALNMLFVENNFELYLSSQTDYSLRQAHIDELFRLIKASGNDFNIEGVIEQLEKVENKGKINEQASNAIYIGTIHSSKGLEYPIVMVCEAGASFKMPYRNPYFLTREIGLGTCLYDFQKNLRTYSPQFLAGKIFKQRKEFVDEIMIFYVALTRAQNHLFIIGQAGQDSIVETDDVFDCKTYLDILFYALGTSFKEQFFQQRNVVSGSWEFSIIGQTKSIPYLGNKNQLKNSQLLSENIEKYIDYKYDDKVSCTFAYKNSVTGLLRIDEENIIKTEENYFSNEGKETSINRGNAYHEALKIIDFSKINSLHDLQRENLKEKLPKGYFELIDLELLLKNILIVKSVIGKLQPIKERQFIMQSTLKEIGVANSDNKVIIQGVIDLLTKGEKTILIDYKFTNNTDEKMIIKKYQKQIELYTLAIEKGFGKNVDERYLLSLKEGKLIKV